MAGVYDNVTTTALDELAAETCAYMTIVHPDYSVLAARIAVSNLHKETKDSFAETVSDLRNYVDGTGRDAPLISEDVFNKWVEARKADDEDAANAIIHEAALALEQKKKLASAAK